MGRVLVFRADVLDGNPVDTESYIPAIKCLKKKYGKKAAGTVATDQGFGSAKNAIAAAGIGVEIQSFSGCRIAESGREHVVGKGRLRKMLDRFRAGAEGLISGIKRGGAGLKRCLWEGYDHFVSCVASMVAAFNVKAIARVLVERMVQDRPKKRLAKC